MKIVVFYDVTPCSFVASERPTITHSAPNVGVTEFEDFASDQAVTSRNKIILCKNLYPTTTVRTPVPCTYNSESSHYTP